MQKSLVATVGQKWCCFTEIKKLEAFDFIGFQLPWSIADSKGFETIQINRFIHLIFLYKNAIVAYKFIFFCRQQKHISPGAYVSGIHLLGLFRVKRDSLFLFHHRKNVIQQKGNYDGSENFVSP